MSNSIVQYFPDENVHDCGYCKGKTSTSIGMCLKLASSITSMIELTINRSDGYTLKWFILVFV